MAPRQPAERWRSFPYSERTEEHLWEEWDGDPPADWAREHTAYGAVIVDPERGISYTVTLHRLPDGTATLRSVNIRLENPEDPEAQKVFRSGLPVKSLKSEAAVWATAAERGELSQDPENPGIWVRASSPGNGGRSRSRPDLAEVAAVWEDSGGRRVKIAEVFSERLGRDVAPSTTNRWIADARKAGLIPPSTRPDPNTRKQG